MRVVTDLPRPVRMIDHVWIPLSDGMRLGARIWLPGGRRATTRCPAILEYIPYRKGDGTAAARPAAPRLLRGPRLRRAARGPSAAAASPDGLLHDEYLPQEQEDALEVLALDRGAAVVHRRRRACSASRGAASTASRWRPTPAGAEGRDQPLLDGRPLRRRRALPRRRRARARDALVGRVDALVQRDPARPRGRRARAGASCGSSASTASSRTSTSGSATSAATTTGSRARSARTSRAIRCPVYAIGGWADGYSEAVLRLLEGLGAPSKGLIGPWSHAFPDEVEPGPGDRLPPGVPALVGPVAEGRGHRDRGRAGPARRGCRSRWRRRRDRWSGPAAGWPSARWPSPHDRASAACGSATGTLARRSPTARRPPARDRHRPALRHRRRRLVRGRHPRRGRGGPARRRRPRAQLHLGPARRAHRAARERARGARARERPAGRAARRAALRRRARRQLAADHPRRPEPHPPGQPRAPAAARAGRAATRVVLELDGIAQAIPAGHRVRLALSPAYWPWLWPAPEPVTLAVHTADSSLVLPVRPPRAEDERAAPVRRARERARTRGGEARARSRAPAP